LNLRVGSTVIIKNSHSSSTRGCSCYSRP